jgi:hypothetical protein
MEGEISQPADNDSVSERKSISSIGPDRGESGPKIFFAPDPKHKEITTLPLTRTFSRNSFSSARDEEEARVKRATRAKNIEPQTILPVGVFLAIFYVLMMNRIPDIEYQC